VSTARLVAKTAARADARRRKREQRVADMSPRSPAKTPDDELRILMGVDENLDECLARLNDADRTAITLRFLQGLSMREVAEQMGTSEAAANKRVTRAVEKLRDMFRRKGITIMPAALGSALLRHVAVALPLQLGGSSVANAALESARAGAAAATHATAAAQLAHATMSSGTMKLAMGVAAAMLLLFALLAGGAATYFALTDHSAHQVAVAPTTPVAASASGPAAAALAPPPMLPTTTTTPAPLRVGVYVSLNTASTVTKMVDGKRNWQSMFRIADEMHDPQLEVIPLIEPLSDRDAETAARLAQTFAGKTPLDVTRISDLRQLDVIVAASVCYPTDDALTAIDTAVRGGTGLVVRQCLGGDANGYTRPVVRSLRLLDQADPDAINATGASRALVVASHPLLGRLSGQTNRVVRLRAYGGHGSLAPGATPLLLVRNTANVVYDHDKSHLKPTSGYVICPLSVGELGQGRIVNAGFTGGPVPADLDVATDGQFMLRAIQWAAGRPLE
jgi:hypothetical protein